MGGGGGGGGEVWVVVVVVVVKQDGSAVVGVRGGEIRGGKSEEYLDLINYLITSTFT